VIKKEVFNKFFIFFIFLILFSTSIFAGRNALDMGGINRYDGERDNIGFLNENNIWLGNNTFLNYVAINYSIIDVNGSGNFSGIVYALDFCYQNGTCVNVSGAGGNSSFNQTLTDLLYVPYTGAYQDVDLGIYDIDATRITATNRLDVEGLTYLDDHLDISKNDRIWILVTTESPTNEAEFVMRNDINLEGNFLIWGSGGVGSDYGVKRANLTIIEATHNALVVGTHELYNITFGTDDEGRWIITSIGDLIPFDNATYDIGNPELQVRNIYISNITANNFCYHNGTCITGGGGGDNSSFNQTLTDLLYASIIWGYNQTYNDTNLLANDTRIDARYFSLIDNSTYLNTFNATYDSYGTAISDLQTANQTNNASIVILTNRIDDVNDSIPTATSNLTNDNQFINGTETNNTYLRLDTSNDPMGGSLDMGTNSIFNATNVTADYFIGQPVKGGVDGGIIQSDEIDDNGNLNLTHGVGLSITYPNFIVRLVSTIDLEEVYCTVPSAEITVPDNAHTAYFVDTNCVVQNVPINTFVDASLNNVGNIPIFHTMAHSGEIEIHQGLPIMNRVYLRSRILSFKTINLDVISGLSILKEEGLNFTITSGEYVFVDNSVSTSIQNLSDGATLEIFYRDGGVYQYDEYEGDSQLGLNLTSCEDASQNIVECSNPTKYRRYFIFLTGYVNGDDDTEIHQRLASDKITYANIGNCLNTEVYPLTYDLPDIYTYTAVPLFAYCGQASSSSFTGNFIDLRTVSTGQASSGIDTSIFLTIDGLRELIGDWDGGDYNISLSQWFNGLFNWTVSSIYASFDGATLTIDDDGLNTSFNFTDEISNLQSANVTVNSAINDLQTANQTNNESIVILSSEISDLQVANNTVNESVANLVTGIADLQTANITNNGSIVILTTAVSDLQTANQTNNGSIVILSTEITALQAANVTNNASITNLITKVDDVNNSIITQTNNNINSTSWNRSGTNIYQTNLGDNIGIGTTNPDYSLTINGTGINITNDSTSANLCLNGICTTSISPDNSSWNETRSLVVLNNTYLNFSQITIGSATPNAYGSIAAGFISGSGSITTGTNAYGSTATGHITANGNITTGINAYGSTATGYAINGNITTGASAYGSTATGYANNGNIITGEEAYGSTATGYTYYGNIITGEEAYGSTAKGYTYYGNITTGDTARGSTAKGNAIYGNIQTGTTAYGSTTTGYAIIGNITTGINAWGAFAGGYARNSEIIANNSNTFAYGNNSQVLGSSIESMALMGGQINNGNNSFVFGKTSITGNNIFAIVGDLNATGKINGSELCIKGSCIDEWNDLNNTVWNRSGTNVFTANLGDNVGIGTIIPSARLDVVGGAIGINSSGTDFGVLAWETGHTFGDSAVMGRMEANGGPITFGALGYMDVEESPIGVYGFQGDGFRAGKFNGSVEVFNGDFFVNKTNFYVDVSSGNVGIGTITPSADLEIQGSLASPKQLLIDQGHVNITLECFGGCGTYPPGNALMYLRYSPEAGGNHYGLLIETDSAEYITGLKINQSSGLNAGWIAELYGTGQSGGLLVEYTGGFNNAFQVNDEANDLTPFVVTNIGKVGIKHGSPSSELEVNGSIETESIIFNENGVESGNLLYADNTGLLWDAVNNSLKVTGKIVGSKICGHSFLVTLNNQPALDGGDEYAAIGTTLSGGTVVYTCIDCVTLSGGATTCANANNQLGVCEIKSTC